MKTYEQILQYIDETLADKSDAPPQHEILEGYYSKSSIRYFSYRESLEQLREWMVKDDT